MTWFLSSPVHLVEAAAKAVLMYAVALAGLRLSDRRTIAQWTAVDFVAAVALGAIVGRTAVARNESFAIGAVVLVVILITHRLIVQLHFVRALRPVLQHRVLVLVDGTEVRDDQLRRCGLTHDDLFAALRQRGIFSLAELRYVLYEAKGGLTIVPSSVSGPLDLVEAVLTDEPARSKGAGKESAGWTSRRGRRRE